MNSLRNNGKVNVFENAFSDADRRRDLKFVSIANNI